MLAALGALQEIVVERYPLQPHRRLEHFDLLRTPVGFRRLLDIHQDPIGVVLNLQKAHVRRGECCLEQIFKHLVVTRNHPVFGGGCQLVGDQLPGAS